MGQIECDKVIISGAETARRKRSSGDRKVRGPAVVEGMETLA